jgi:hypothetical protein
VGSDEFFCKIAISCLDSHLLLMVQTTANPLASPPVVRQYFLGKVICKLVRELYWARAALEEEEFAYPAFPASGSGRRCG